LIDETRKPVDLVLSATVLEGEILAFDVTKFSQFEQNILSAVICGIRTHAEKAEPRDFRERLRLSGKAHCQEHRAKCESNGFFSHVFYPAFLL
jgi:hypothetical protein